MRFDENLFGREATPDEDFSGEFTQCNVCVALLSKSSIPAIDLLHEDEGNCCGEGAPVAFVFESGSREFADTILAGVIITHQICSGTASSEIVKRLDDGDFL